MGRLFKARCCSPAAERSDRIATVLRRPLDGPLYGARRGAGGGSARGEKQCRRASRPSSDSNCRRTAPPLPCRARVLRTHRTADCSRRSIELAGLALGIGFIVAVAFDHSLSNDELWSLAAGQWMLDHHRIIGLDPFSYTEAHRRWVADEWGSEVALAALFRAFGNAAYPLYAIVLGGAVPRAERRLRTRPRARRGGRVAAIVLLLSFGIAGTVVEDRGLDFSLVWFPFELLVLTKARENPRWLRWLPPLCLVWVNTHGSILIGLLVLGVELGWSLVPARLVGADRRGGAVARTPAPWGWRCSAASLAVVRHALRSRTAGLRHRRLAAMARSRSTSTSGTRPISIR